MLPTGELSPFLASLCGPHEKFELFIPWCLENSGIGAVGRNFLTVEARKLEHDATAKDENGAHKNNKHDGAPTPSRRKQGSQHRISYVHVPTFWSLL